MQAGIVIKQSYFILLGVPFRDMPTTCTSSEDACDNHAGKEGIVALLLEGLV